MGSEAAPSKDGVVSTASPAKRGALIVFEGCDRSGKTTICRMLNKALNEGPRNSEDDAGKPFAKFMRFPDRTTEVGKWIDSYLSGRKDLDDRVIHLLFSANRWELVNDLRNSLLSGVHVVVDRYAFSGVAFSAAKGGMSFDWCRQPDRGLPKPDLVCFLDVSPEEAAKRGGFGTERYERSDFQAEVRKVYDQLMDDTWKTFCTDGKSLDEVFAEVEASVSALTSRTDLSPEILQLWPFQGAQ